jgi:addiction module HigA family antidote
MLKRQRRPTPPGVILRAYYLEPRKLSVAQFATATGLSRKHVSNIVHDHAAISPETAVRFAAVLDTTPEFWINLQTAVDLHDARHKLKKWRPAKLVTQAAAAE